MKMTSKVCSASLSYSIIAGICSVAFFSLGIIAQNSIAPFYNIDPSFADDPTSLPMLLRYLIGISGISTLMACACCLCFMRHKHTAIACIVLVVTVALIGEQVVIYKCYEGRNEAFLQIETNLNISLPQYYNNTYATQFWDTLQTDMKCCGVNGLDDWSDVFDNSTLPSSCCAFNDTTLDQMDCNNNNPDVSQAGCGLKVVELLHENLIAMFAMTLAIVVLEVVAILGCCTCILLLHCLVVVRNDDFF